MASTPLLDTDPAQVGSCRLMARLGAGGMGVVYLAAARDGGRVAVKLLRPELVGDAEFRTRFGREVAALTRVRGVCTVRVIEADTESPRPFLVTEYIDGPSLAEYVPARGPLDAQMLYGLATGLAEALTAIHAAGIVHRDLKPSNVLLTAAGPKVIDFGIAQAVDATALTRTGMTVGSAGFMAPEQVTGRAGTPADIFSWALTIAYAASGRQPFGTGSSDAVLYRILHGTPDIAAVPASLRPQVTAALARDPATRPTAPELLSQLTGTATQSTGHDNATQTVLAQTWQPSAQASRAAAADRLPEDREAPPRAPGAKRAGLRRPVLVAIVLVLAIAAGATGAALALTGQPAAGHGTGTGGAVTHGQTVAPTVTNNSPFSASPTPASSAGPTSAGSGSASSSTSASSSPSASSTASSSSTTPASGTTSAPGGTSTPGTTPTSGSTSTVGSTP